jgi:hypothetical protein
MKIGFALRIVVAWIVFVAAEMVAGMLLPVHLPMVPHSFPWLLAANLLTVTTLAWAGSRSGWSRIKLMAALFVLGFGIVLVNGVEASFFLMVPGISWTTVILQQGFAQLILAATLAMLIAAPESDRGNEGWLGGKSPTVALGTFLASDALYLVLYFTFGMLVVPFVRDWYASQHIPSFRTISTLQLLLRGPVFVLLCILLTKMLSVRRVSGALMVGLVFTVLTGVTQLMVPSAVFPDAVRWAHFCEVSSSMFLFGFLMSTIWKPKSHKLASQTVATPA